MENIARAFVVTAPDYEDGAVIVFATHGLQARRLGASRMGHYYEETEYSVKRDPKFDKWAVLGYVPEKAFLEEGWYIYSEYWQRRMNEPVTREQYDELEKEYPDHMDGLYIPDELVESPNRKHIYLNMKEVEQHAHYLDGFFKAGEDFKAYVEKNFPEYEVTKWQCDYPMFTKIAEFTFPGSKYGGSIRWQDHDTPIENIQVYVAYGDQQAYDDWRKECQK